MNKRNGIANTTPFSAGDS